MRSGIPGRSAVGYDRSDDAGASAKGSVLLMTTFREASGNLLASEADALVNTVNVVGVMGKGIALQFKRAYPANFEAYEAACKQQQVRLGEMFVFDAG